MVANEISPAVPADVPVDSRTAIRVERVGVRYSLRFTRKTTLHRSFVNLFVRQPADEFWALRDVSFDLVHGESLAVIGPNGAGKSTLLQVLAGIILPSEGSVEVDGLISSLLTLGAGFDRRIDAGRIIGIDMRQRVGDEIAHHKRRRRIGGKQLFSEFSGDAGRVRGVAARAGRNEKDGHGGSPGLE